MTRSSGKWVMYFVSLHGHGMSCSPSASGAPTECRAGTKAALVCSILRSTLSPQRAMMSIETAT